MGTNKKISESLEPMFGRLLAMATGVGEDDVALLFQSLETDRQHLGSWEYRVVFCGEYNAGKSTLVNSLLKTEVLPHRAIQATGLVTSIRHAASPAATITYRDAEMRLVSAPVPFDRRGEYILLDAVGRRPAANAHVETICLEMPSPGLPVSLVMVDTPSPQDGEDLTRGMWEELQRADVAVVVLKATQLLSASELERARTIDGALDGNILFAINRMGQVHEDEWSDVEARAELGLQGLGNSLVGYSRCFFTDAESALSASGDCERGETGVDALREWLISSVQSGRMEAIALARRLCSLETNLRDALVLLDQRRQQACVERKALEQKHQQETEAERRGRDLVLLKAQAAVAEVRNRCADLERTMLAAGACVDATDLASYEGALSQSITDALRGTQVVVPPLTLTAPYVPPSSTPPRNSGWGRLVGAAIGTVLAPGPGTGIGYAIGSVIDKSRNSGHDGPGQPSAFDVQMSAIRRQVADHLSVTEAAITKLIEEPLPERPLPARVFSLRQYEGRVNAVLTEGEEAHALVRLYNERADRSSQEGSGN